GKSVAWGFPKGKTRPLFHLGELRLGTTTSPGELRGPSLEEGALTLKSTTKTPYWARDVMKDGELNARLGVPHRSHVPWRATFVGPQRVSMSGDWGGFFLYDVATRKRIREFKTAEGRIAGTAVITSIAASPDKARYLATNGIDQMLRIWDPERERPLLTLYVHGED